MRLLLDTHTFLWLATGNARLSDKAAAALLDARNEKRLSVVSLWEIAIKSSMGKLSLGETFRGILARVEAMPMLRRLAIEEPHLLRLHDLPRHHGDPFDRLLVAQALAEGMTLVSVDPAMDAYGVPRLW